MDGSKGVILTGATLAEEVLSALHWPGASILERAVTAALERRRAEVRNMLLEAIRREGIENLQFEEGEADDLVQMMMRFAKASEEGVARANLKLLAQVIIGLKRNHAFEFDKFQSCANVLENFLSGMKSFSWGGCTCTIVTMLGPTIFSLSLLQFQTHSKPQVPTRSLRPSRAQASFCQSVLGDRQVIRLRHGFPKYVS